MIRSSPGAKWLTRPAAQVVIYDEVGEPEKVAHHAYLAHGHNQLAIHHDSEAAKLHAEERDSSPKAVTERGPKKKNAARERSVSFPHTKLQLLVVYDEPSLRMSLSLVPDSLGYDVRSAADGFAALSEIRKEVPNIILSDLNMPGMSGFELLSVVRRRFPAIPVIAMSGAFAGSEIPDGLPADAF